MTTSQLFFLSTPSRWAPTSDGRPAITAYTDRQRVGEHEPDFKDNSPSIARLRLGLRGTNVKPAGNDTRPKMDHFIFQVEREVGRGFLIKTIWNRLSFLIKFTWNLARLLSRCPSSLTFFLFLSSSEIECVNSTIWPPPSPSPP